MALGSSPQSEQFGYDRGVILNGTSNCTSKWITSLLMRSVQELLSAPVNPKKQEFWTEFKRSLLGAKAGPLDRRAGMNLKLVFNEIGNDSDMLAVMSHFLKVFS